MQALGPVFEDPKVHSLPSGKRISRDPFVMPVKEDRTRLLAMSLGMIWALHSKADCAVSSIRLAAEPNTRPRSMLENQFAEKSPVLSYLRLRERGRPLLFRPEKTLTTVSQTQMFGLIPHELNQ